MLGAYNGSPEVPEFVRPIIRRIQKVVVVSVARHRHVPQAQMRVLEGWPRMGSLSACRLTGKRKKCFSACYRGYGGWNKFWLQGVNRNFIDSSLRELGKNENEGRKLSESWKNPQCANLGRLTLASIALHRNRQPLFHGASFYRRVEYLHLGRTQRRRNV